MMNENRNMMTALLISALILLAWQYVVGVPKIEEQRTKIETMQTVTDQDKLQTNAPVPLSHEFDRQITVNREQILASSPRIRINTPNIGGSINLTDGRIDDIVLQRYHETIDPDSKKIVLLSPEGAENASYARFGWVSEPNNSLKLPDAQTVWILENGATLTPSTSVTLVHDNGDGLLFRRVFSIDRDYMLTVSDEVVNNGEKSVSLHPYSAINNHGTPETAGFYILHEGIIGVLGEEEGLQSISYSKLQDQMVTEIKGKKGWLGITSKYWAFVLAPDQTIDYRARITAFPDGDDFIYQTSFLHDARKIAPGMKTNVTTRFFTGAKEVSVIDNYEKSADIYKFEQLIDWGLFYFITKPLFSVMDFFYAMLGNFGATIIVITILMKLLFFPLANKSYIAMGKMKLLQPELLRIRETYKDDQAKMQQELMTFYKEKKINPAAGCLPVIIQIPVFFALYKVLFVTIEMRQAPFFGWIQDLAAPDPTNLFNIFGLIPWDPAIIPIIGSVMHVGIWPILMGISMFLQMRLAPISYDPIQAMIFNWMPILFTFMLASFPAGLVIYWTCNNILSIIQQATIMKRQGVQIELWSNLKQMFIRSRSVSSRNSEE